ncbi:hypothetical protein JW766_02355 [Candidatus Dojkabacteria bacterium]|nr:hypothetical protein [Candidatus Dojkabacteria bacterium]
MITIGIQGGKGSYNEEACNHFCKVNGIKDYEIKYLFTTEKVLENLHLGRIDYAQFAIEDPSGGIVNESIDALTKYTCKIIDKFKYPMNHCLLIHKDVSMDDVKTVMTHPHIYKQCINTLKEKYPQLEVKIGKGDLIDQSKVAEKISEGDIDKTTAVIGSKLLAEIYSNLKVIEEGIQDSKDNYTTFMFCKRRYII